MMFGADAFGRAYRSTLSTTRDTGSREGRRALSKTEELEARCDRLALLCEAMWTLLRDHCKLSDEQLLDRITEIDLTDGRLDGRAGKTGPIECHKCQRRVARRFAQCMYCGAPLAHDPFS